MISGEQIRAAAGILKLSKTALGKAAGVTPNQCGKAFEADGIHPDVAEVFYVTLQTFFEECGVRFVENDTGMGVEIDHGGVPPSNADTLDKASKRAALEGQLQVYGKYYTNLVPEIDPTTPKWNELSREDQIAFKRAHSAAVRGGPPLRSIFKPEK